MTRILDQYQSWLEGKGVEISAYKGIELINLGKLQLSP